MQLCVLLGTVKARNEVTHFKLIWTENSIIIWMPVVPKYLTNSKIILTPMFYIYEVSVFLHHFTSDMHRQGKRWKKCRSSIFYPPSIFCQQKTLPLSKPKVSSWRMKNLNDALFIASDICNGEKFNTQLGKGVKNSQDYKVLKILRKWTPKGNFFFLFSFLFLAFLSLARRKKNTIYFFYGNS